MGGLVEPMQLISTTLLWSFLMAPSESIEVKMQTVCQTVCSNRWPSVTVMRREVNIPSYSVMVNENILKLTPSLTSAEVL